MTFKNKNLSYSRLTRFEQCPLSFKLHYIEKHKAEPCDHVKFGKAIHAVLEQLIREHVHDKRVGQLSENRAIELLRSALTSENLVDIDLFQDGAEILRTFVAEQGDLDHMNVLAIEKEFRLPVCCFTVLGFIDRVDYVDDDTIEVIEYKTNRQIFTRDEVDSSLQMSIYRLAAQRLWPWANKVRLTFHMLRHGLRMMTERTTDQLNDALAYVEKLGRHIEAAKNFPPRLDAHCSYCDHRNHCPAYAESMTGKRDEEQNK